MNKAKKTTAAEVLLFDAGVRCGREEAIKDFERLWNKGVKNPKGKTPQQLFEEILTSLKEKHE